MFRGEISGCPGCEYEVGGLMGHCALYLVDGDRRFGGAYCHHHKGDNGDA